MLSRRDVFQYGMESRKVQFPILVVPHERHVNLMLWIFHV